MTLPRDPGPPVGTRAAVQNFVSGYQRRVGEWQARITRLSATVTRRQPTPDEVEEVVSLAENVAAESQLLAVEVRKLPPRVQQDGAVDDLFRILRDMQEKVDAIQAHWDGIEAPPKPPRRLG